MEGDALDVLLRAFMREMRDKFEARAAKHPGSSNVCDADFDWQSLKHWDVWDHFVCEIGELLSARSHADRKKESVDVANMAFLEWASKEAK